MKYSSAMQNPFADSTDHKSALTADARGVGYDRFDSFWGAPRFPTKLSDNDVHVWWLKLEQADLCAVRFASILTEKERTRAASLFFERDRNRFILCRGVLRTVLGSYLNTEPDRLEFSYGSYGKPYLAGAFSEESVQFSLAHSHELALYVFTRGRKVGIDLERIRNIPDVDQVAARFLSRRENAMFRTLPRGQRLKAFFGFWTRKEAYGKAIGIGLAQPLDGFSMSMMPEEPDRSFNMEENAREACCWSIMSFTPAPEYTAALAAEGHSLNLNYYQYMPHIACKPMCSYR